MSLIIYINVLICTRVPSECLETSLTNVCSLCMDTLDAHHLCDSFLLRDILITGRSFLLLCTVNLSVSIIVIRTMHSLKGQSSQNTVVCTLSAATSVVERLHPD